MDFVDDNFEGSKKDEYRFKLNFAMGRWGWDVAWRWHWVGIPAEKRANIAGPVGTWALEGLVGAPEWDLGFIASF